MFFSLRSFLTIFQLLESDRHQDREATRLRRHQEAQQEVTSDRKGKSPSHIEARKSIESGLDQGVEAIHHHTNEIDVTDDIEFKLNYLTKEKFSFRSAIDIVLKFCNKFFFENDKFLNFF